MLMVRVLPLCVVDRGFRTPVDRGFRTPVDHLRSGEITIKLVFAASPNHAAIMNKSKNWLDQNQDNASDWSDIAITGLLFQL
jgi:predicted nucleotidyltransferase